MGTGARRGHSKSQRVKRGSKWTKEDMAESRWKKWVYRVSASSFEKSSAVGMKCRGRKTLYWQLKKQGLQ